MKSWSRRHLTDRAAFSKFIAADDDDRVRLPELLADLAEVDARKLYLPKGYSSMREYCVHVRHWSHDVARKRIRAARKGRQFPEIFDALSDGRLHLTAVAMLAKHLRRDNVSQLIAAATHKTMDEVAVLLAIRFPSEPVSTVFRPIGREGGAARPLTPAEQVGGSPVCGVSDTQAFGQQVDMRGETAPSLDFSPAEESVSEPCPPLASPPAAIYELRCTLPSKANELVVRAQDLRGESNDPAGIPDLIVAALEHYVAHLEKQKFATTPKPRAVHSRPSTDPRHIPAEVKRAVRERDGDRCTFVGSEGHRCESRAVQFDHILAVARGGKSTTDNIRLLCHAHNQYEAEQTYGTEFMEARRRESIEMRARGRRAGAVTPAAEVPGQVGSAVAAVT
jgi:hypothetical protein